MSKLVDICNLFVTIDYNENTDGCGLLDQAN